jgi:HAMP domain-containing protein
VNRLLALIAVLFALRYVLRHLSSEERVDEVDDAYDIFHDPYLETLARAA